MGGGFSKKHTPRINIIILYLLYLLHLLHYLHSVSQQQYQHAGTYACVWGIIGDYIYTNVTSYPREEAY